MDQIIIGDKASFDDFSASLAQRKIKMPKKKSIKETVPFSNITYDFSDIDGETYWEERELEYTFEIDADTPEELEELKHKFSSWVMGVKEGEIHDPFIPNHHFRGTYDNIDIDDDEGLDKSTLTVTFTAYPYMIADEPTVYDIEIGASVFLIEEVINESDHPVPLTIENTVGITLGFSTTELSSIPSGSGTYSTLRIPKGVNEVRIINSEAKAGTVRLSFIEEVL